MKRDAIPVHPAAELFPLLGEKELHELAADITQNGQRYPIVTYRGQLLDGRNRLRACALAGVEPEFHEWAPGDPNADPIAYIVSVNIHRRHLDESQRGMVAARIATMRKGANQHAPIGASSQAQEAAAELLNVGRRTVQRARDVLDHGAPELVAAVDAGAVAVSTAADVAELPHEEQRELVVRGEKAVLEAAKKIKAKKFAEKIAQRRAVAEQIAQEPPPMPTGPFRVIVADPPWPYEKRANDPTHRGSLPYPPMSIEEICAMPVGELSHKEGSILWLWTTNAFMREAFLVLDAWGFREKTILTWVKNKMGLGDWLRGRSEHCVLAVRGSPLVPVPGNETTVLEAPSREHSRKPDEFYALVERLCVGSKLELFAREPRKGWTAWGAEATKFGAESSHTTTSTSTEKRGGKSGGPTHHPKARTTSRTSARR